MAIDPESLRRHIREELAAERRERERDERDAARDREIADLRSLVGKQQKRDNRDAEPDDDADHKPEV